MVSYQKLKHVVGDKLLVEAVCLSTDTTPTENIADSSKLTEQDTGKKYLFNGGTWYNVTYGWGGFTVSYYNGATGELISTERVATGGTPAEVPGSVQYWFENEEPDSGSVLIDDPAMITIYDDTSFWGWETDPRG